MEIKKYLNKLPSNGKILVVVVVVVVTSVVVHILHLHAHTGHNHMCNMLADLSP